MNWQQMLLGAGLVALLPGVAGAGIDGPADKVGFNRDVRPILSDKCYACHGPDANTRKGDLRLDIPPPEGQSVEAIVAGDPDASALIHRITTTDVDDQMPPVDQKKQLTDNEKSVLRQWISQGASYEPHWAYIPPEVNAAHLTAGEVPIDTLVGRKLARMGVASTPETDRRTLIRRLYWDLLGVPPTPEAVADFVNDAAPEAYERLVDGLLQSPHYGERMAMEWLDVVRYADSNGYHSDEFRSISAYRDYVINAFNTNMPFDQFTREQLAGDLMPDPSREQLIASGYNRLNQITAEGGAQAKEYIAKYAADRVRTTTAVWLGATMGCAECHDHKFDPLSTKDFYAFSAFFADIEEDGVYRSGAKWAPFMYLPTPEESQREAELTAAITGLDATLAQSTPALEVAQSAWESQTALSKRNVQATRWQVLRPADVTAQGETTFRVLEDGRVLAAGEAQERDVYTVRVPTDGSTIESLMLEVFNHPELNGLSRGGSNFVLTQFEANYRGPDGQEASPLALAYALADYSQDRFPVGDALNGDKNRGWAVDGHLKKEDHLAVFALRESLVTAPGGTLEIALHFESGHKFHQSDCFRLRYTRDANDVTPWAVLPEAIREALDVPRAARTEAQVQELGNYFRAITPQLHPERVARDTRVAELEALKAGMATTLIAKSLPEPRVVRVLPRGNWLDESGEVVLPDTPKILPALGVNGRRATRLDLANWIVREDNPLTARVTMNRLWKRFYGTGISKVLDDLGAQGEWPTHPQLLDWLATEFVDSGWNMKHMVRLMVTSKTYRQSSETNDAILAKDPYNRLFARQSRYRVEAELIRDGALAMSGLLAPHIGGRSVFPYQPEGYYANCNTFGGVLAYDTDTGDDQYRRGLYTFWKRSFLHPSLLAFDAPNREECTAERTISNTPLQALVLLNDPTYVETARVFAERIMAEAGERSDDRISLAFRYALSREPDAQELEVLRALYHKHLMEYTEDKAAATALTRAGMAPTLSDLDAADVAAWTSVTRVILNLHETITRS